MDILKKFIDNLGKMIDNKVMKEEYKAQQMLNHMKAGKIYRQSELQGKWPNASHDLAILVKNKYIDKVSAGLYYKPKKTKYGIVAPKDEEIVRSFLQDDDFLLVDVNCYTSLVGGLTQLSMGCKVLNKRRHGLFNLAGFYYDFRVRRAYPKKITREFLLVDLLDNIKEVEDGTPIREKLLPRLKEYNSKELLQAANLFGNRSTEKLLEKVLNE